MSKKDLKTGVDALLGVPRAASPIEEELKPETIAILAEARGKKRPGRPKKEFVEDDGYFRTTIIAHKENYEKLKVVAMKLGRTFKDVLNDALAAAVETFEERNGEIILRDRDHENPFK
jgi:hypothetical protein